MAKDKISEMFQKDAKVSHKEVANGLNISRTSTIRYLDELENEGKIVQVGKTGKSVFYIKK